MSCDIEPELSYGKTCEMEGLCNECGGDCGGAVMGFALKAV